MPETPPRVAPTVNEIEARLSLSQELVSSLDSSDSSFFSILDSQVLGWDFTFP